jgi:Kef-type K+ transport system membrane component KefB
LHLLKQVFVPSIIVAITGIILPIALSFLLIPLFVPATVTRLTAFAAGGALSSTSLGTTFTILLAAKLTSTKVGTVLITAAMIDDVVGLVMVRVVSSLGGSVDAEDIARPVGVSIGFLLAVLAITQVAKMIQIRFSMERFKVTIDGIGFIVTGTFIMGIAAAAGYAGTSLLFSVYLGGVSASYLCQQNALRSFQRYTI